MSNERIEVKILDPGDVEEVEVVEVSVKAGDTVAVGDILLEVATDKANMDIEAPAAGTLDELLVAEGDIIDPKQTLAWITPEMAEANPETTGRGDPEVTKLGIVRRAMVRSTLAGAAVPAFYLRLTADVSDLLARRKALGDPPDGARKATVNDLVVRAAGLALREHPGVNASYVDGEVHLYPRVNVGVAMAIPGGLVVPAVYDADRKSIDEIAAAVRDAAALAARRKLTRELLADATFTVSNLGMFGIEDFDPIVNTPQAAILGVGTAVKDAQGRSLLRLSLGCDHRVLTGAEGAPFLATLRDHLEAPQALFPQAH